jgi:hypothetical protein
VLRYEPQTMIQVSVRSVETYESTAVTEHSPEEKQQLFMSLLHGRVFIRSQSHMLLLRTGGFHLSHDVTPATRMLRDIQSHTGVGHPVNINVLLARSTAL